MVSSIWEDIKRQFQYGDMLMRIILVNLGVFLAVNLTLLVLFFIYQQDAYTFLQKILTWFEASHTLKHNLTRPWTIFTYMFLHEGLWHLVWNMLFLYWFGRILKDLAGNQRILPIYLLGGLAGFAAFVISAKLLPASVGTYMLGASAGVMAVVLAVATLAPDYKMHLLFIGAIPLKYIAAAFIILDLISIPKGNTGGHFAHLGGALMGAFFVLQLKSGNDLSVRVNNFLEGVVNYLRYVGNIFSGKGGRSGSKNKTNKSRTGAKASHKSDEERLSQQEELDSILEKIKRSGYQSLTEEEKDFLFRASKNK